MVVFLTLIHVVVAIFLIMVVLLQTGKGAEMGASFGGASNTLFGSSGPADFLAKLTTSAAIIFMLTSLSLAYMSLRKVPSASGPVGNAPVSLPAPKAPVAPVAPVAPGGGTPPALP